MKIEINLNEKTKAVDIKFDKPTQVDDILSVLFTAQLNAMKEFITSVEASGCPKKDLISLKEYLYDSYNAGASNVLYLFIPDKELHPDLTVEAMKEAEDKYMYNHLNRESRRSIDKKTNGETKSLRRSI